MIYFTSPTELTSCILIQVLWYNKYEQINKRTVYFKRFSEHNINFEKSLIDKSGKYKSWHLFKTEYNLNCRFFFQWIQLTDAISKAWEHIVQNNINNNGFLTLTKAKHDSSHYTKDQISFNKEVSCQRGILKFDDNKPSYKIY